MTDDRSKAEAEPAKSGEGSPPRRHRGDIMSVEKRSAVMARIRSRDTGPERTVAELMTTAGLTFEMQARDLPGRPDFVFRAPRVAVLVDGDFWHGWQFALWRDKLSPAWEAKIAKNRERDSYNIRQLRHSGWRVVRLWEHQITADPGRCIQRVKTALAAAHDANGVTTMKCGLA